MAPDRSVFRDDLFDGRVVLVTGGGTGIGRRIATELAALGAQVVLAARRQEPLEATAAQITAAGGRADWMTLDIRDADAVEEAVAVVAERYERIDGLVNNAGGQFPAPAQDISPNGWRTVVDLNLNGAFLMSRAVFRAAMAEHGGSIVSILADFWNGFPGMAHTGAARAGVANLTKTLAVEWAGHRVRVNAVAPGLIDSSGMDTYAPEIRQAVAAAARGIPAGRMGTEAEVSAAVVFLLSDAASFITGDTLRIDGGGSLHKQPLLPMGTESPIPPYTG
ncbi:MAG TPA: SDR family oxidoreductase [Egibacteraceae bacterium]|nr:SDR family oxidoreductase [Egibacteraceae bacterium]